MDTDLSYFFATAVLSFILISAGIALYLKQRQNLFFRYINKRKHTFIKNVDITFVNPTTVDVNLTYKTANIIFLENEIFIIPFNRPILHLNSNPEIILPGTQKHQILSKSISDNLMKIKVNDVTGSMTVILNLKNKNVELPSIDKNL
ncbi:hypothetical protein H5J24_09020 [Chryseobacterium capnotolerans]|uniref:hypothetical protein n=1 Tax=Chryseobacterium TaxID=59732 RepID=UPI000839DF47|nr:MULTISPECIES: hypothetical protein [Chryseobacterium]UHO40121.1 hypothetical protein H5J24_09020 [Chryseobacterium capnotolerans]